MLVDGPTSRPLTGRELDAVRWLAVLTPEDRATLAPRLRAATFSPREFVIRSGDPASHWCGVLQGIVKVAHPTVENRPMTFSSVPAGGWLGEGTLLKGHPYRYDVQALRRSVIAFITAEDFRALTARSTAFNRFLLGQLNERLSQFIEARAIDRIEDLNQQVARSLALLMNPVLFPNENAFLMLSQGDLAQIIGISRQRVNRALSELSDAGVLRVEYGGIRVLSRELLHAIGAGSHAPRDAAA